MAHARDTTATITASTSNPVTKAYTCGAGSTLLVLMISYAPTRTGTPTYGGINLVQADSTRAYATSPEAAAEIWYLLMPPIAQSLTLSIPNSVGTSIWGVISSYKAASGYSSVLDAASGNSGLSANPSLAPSAAIAGDVMVEILGDGYLSVPSGRTHTSIDTKDWGAYIAAAQDGLIQNSGTVTAGFTESSDDWGMVCALFKEQALTAPVNVKTVNGLAVASVKTLRSGLLSATGKTFNGLT